MSTLSSALRPTPLRGWAIVRENPATQAFILLRTVFTVAPILFGLDKFVNVLTDDWTRYLAGEFNDLIPGSAANAMYGVGVVEIIAGLLVLLAPRVGGLVVAAWLAGIIVNLLLVGGYGDIALRDFGLLIAAVSLSRLAASVGGRRNAPAGMPGSASSASQGRP
jgi:hypothetical protein